MQFANPRILWLLLLIVPLFAWYVLYLRKTHPTLAISSVSPFEKRGTPFRATLRHVAFGLRLVAIGCLIIILARPQLKDDWRTSSTEGTDIVIAMDLSSSMLARDLKPSRLEASKTMAAEFVAKRPSDNIGVVIFAGEAMTGLPMTVDHDAVVNYINALDQNMLPDGTAIGDGIATALNRIIGGKAKSKSIILLTDGSYNTGLVAPVSASEIAKNKNVRVYTVGIGSEGMAESPSHYDELGRIVYTKQKVVIDENTLKTIASKTGGKYFRATNNNTLSEIFNEIDRLEKTKMDVRHFSHTEDDYMLWAWILLACFGVEIFMRYTVLRSIP